VSIDPVVILGNSFSLSTVLDVTGMIGGCFPLVNDLIRRLNLPQEKKIDLNVEFWLVKLLVIPIIALIITSLAVAFGNVTTWLAALYLGASLPVLVEKALGSSHATVNGLSQQQ